MKAQLFTVSMFHCCFDTSVNCVCVLLLTSANLFQCTILAPAQPVHREHAGSVNILIALYDE